MRYVKEIIEHRHRRMQLVLSVILLLLLGGTPLRLSAQFRQSALVTSPVLPTTRIVAGVKTMTHDRDAFSRATSLELVGAPIAVAGGLDVDPAFDLTGVDMAELMSDGRLITLARRSGKLLQFAPDGKPEQQIGRLGGGPGEFRSLEYLFRMRGDTVFVPDRGNGRANWVIPTKGVVRQQPLPRFESIDYPEVLGATGSANFILASTSVDEKIDPDKVGRAMTRFYSGTASGMPKLLVEIRGAEFKQQRATFRGRTSSSPAVMRFAHRPAFQFFDSLMVTGNGEGYAFEYRNANGSLVARTTMPSTTRRVTQAMRDAEMNAAVKQFRAINGRGERMVDPRESERLVREAPFTDSLPSYWSFFMSPNKTLWVLDYISPIDTAWTATAFRADGAIIGRLTVKGKSMPLAFGDDRVVIRSEDDDGVVSLTVRRIGVSPAKRN